ncbi:MAG: hypothetical protein RLZZ244_2453, partial [Verrucomicrobiota bacterium]
SRRTLSVERRLARRKAAMRRLAFRGPMPLMRASSSAEHRLRPPREPKRARSFWPISDTPCCGMPFWRRTPSSSGSLGGWPWGSRSVSRGTPVSPLLLRIALFTLRNRISRSDWREVSRRGDAETPDGKTSGKTSGQRAGGGRGRAEGFYSPMGAIMASRVVQRFSKALR